MLFALKEFTTSSISLWILTPRSGNSTLKAVSPGAEPISFQCYVSCRGNCLRSLICLIRLLPFINMLYILVYQRVLSTSLVKCIYCQTSLGMFLSIVFLISNYLWITIWLTVVRICMYSYDQSNHIDETVKTYVPV